MLNIEEEFQKDRKIEKKFHALVNYFQLLVIGKNSQQNYEDFCLMDGMKKVNQLLNDINQENIYFYEENGSIKETITLYQELIDLYNILNSGMISLSPTFSFEMDNIDRITSYCHRNNYVEEGFPSDFEVLLSLPIRIIADFPELRQIILRNQKQKKLGER